MTTLFLVAGEPSGDLLGARLMQALRQRHDGIRFVGVGGPRMAAAGLDSLFPIEDLSLVGLAEVLPRARLLLRRLRQTAEAARDMAPDAMVTIDAPGFNFRLGRRLAGRRFPLIHYVAPTVWAWRPGRAREIAGFLDHLLALLPFEPPLFEREGLACSFVGHPIVDSGTGEGDGVRFRRHFGLPPAAPLLCLLPGSRSGEVRRLLPLFRETADRLARRLPGLHIVVPTVETVAAEIRAGLDGWRLPHRLTTGDPDKYDAFAASTLALAASGTVALELAMAGVPNLVAYRLNPVTGWLARFVLTTRYVNLVNIVLDRPVVPELLQADCTVPRLTETAMRLLDDEAARAAQRRAGVEVARLLGAGGPSPSQRAAEAVLGVLARRGR